MKLCSFDGCGKKAICHGFCAGHNRQSNAGEVLRPLQLQYHGFSEIKRFLMRVDKRGNTECWPWTGSRQLKWHGQWRNSSGAIESTHRAAWRLFVGPITEGMHVLHRCDNPICLNPSHLFLGTGADNARDMWAKNRAKPGVSIGEKHGMSKLTADIVREIRDSPLMGTELAKKFGVTPTTISEIRKRKTWNHI